MKETNSTINTIPSGAWEAGTTDDALRNCHRTSSSPSTDGQKNGYPPKKEPVDPLPESTRPRKDGPGGD